MKTHKLANALLASMLLSAAPMAAQKVPAGAKPISDELIGIFFEDISSSADGGLSAELIQNGSFEYSPMEQGGWGPGTAWRFENPGHSLGYMQPRMDNPLCPQNPTYMRIGVERIGHYYDFNGWTGVGLRNDGYDGITLKAGKDYHFSVFMRKAPVSPSMALPKDAGQKAMPVTVSLVTPGPECRKLAEAKYEVNATKWQSYEVTLTPTEDCPNAALLLHCMEPGCVDVDMMSLMPADTYKGHGLRTDLVQALADLHPRFLRFPGGCVVHGGGDGFWNTYRWKETIGPREQRRQQKNAWGYHQSLSLGYYEYFQLCEDLNMQPLPILPCGVSCQGAGGGWGMREQAQDVCPMDQMDEWVQDALDLIEWANGDATTTWGRKRIEQGHPEPFGLKYLGIGNEERISPEFAERFKYMYERVRKAHPEIIIVGTAGPGSHPGNYDYENGWKLAVETDLPIMDEHYYERQQYYLDSRQYDNYPRDRKTKVYLGEYSAQSGQPRPSNLGDALAEALYLLHVERNGDIVCMTSYAPLFAKKGHINWNPNLIYFDNTGVVPTCSYYVQQMFGNSSGQYYYGDCVTFKPGPEAKQVEQSVILNKQKRELYVKMCNVSNQEATANLNLSRFSIKGNAEMTQLTGDPEAVNNFDGQPIHPTQESIRVGKKATITLPAHSFTMLKFKI